MQGHLHTDGLIHIVYEDDVGWTAPVYGFVSFCDVLNANRGTWISSPSDHPVARATCLLCITEASRT